MAFFKFRKGGDDSTAATAPPESVEVLRKRAKHRLIGTAILVLLAVIGFPLLVDKQPRPIEVNIPIEIPNKDKVKPLAAPVAVAPAPAPVPVASVANVAPPTAASSGRVGNVAVPVAPKPAAKPAPTPQMQPESKPVARPAAAGEERFVVQVGAFADVNRAREARRKLERAGLKTYTQVVESKEGSRIRVRVGPFVSKVQADKAAEKIRKLDLPAAVLIL